MPRVTDPLSCHLLPVAHFLPLVCVQLDAEPWREGDGGTGIAAPRGFARHFRSALSADSDDDDDDDDDDGDDAGDRNHDNTAGDDGEGDVEGATSGRGDENTPPGAGAAVSAVSAGSLRGLLARCGPLEPPALTLTLSPPREPERETCVPPAPPPHCL